MEYRQRYPQAYAQAYPQMHPPNYPENHQNFVPPNTHGLPSGLVHGGHAPNGTTIAHTQHDRSVSSTNPYTAHAAHAQPPQGPIPPTQHSSNVTPVLGANTFRQNASVSPEKGSADVSSTPQAASSLKVHDINTATNALTLEDAVAMSEQARASATTEDRPAAPDSSIHTPKAKESPIPAPATKPRARSPALTEDPTSPSPAPTLKRKLSPSSADLGRKPRKYNLSFDSLNRLYKRETTK